MAIVHANAQHVTSLLDELVSAYVIRSSYAADGGRISHHIVTGWVRSIALDDKGGITALIEAIYCGYDLFGTVEQTVGDLVTVTSQIEGTLRLSRTDHPFAATEAPGFPAPRVPDEPRVETLAALLASEYDDGAHVWPAIDEPRRECWRKVARKAHDLLGGRHG